MTHEEVRNQMQEGRLYLPGDPDIIAEQADCLELLYDYNATRPHHISRRQDLLRLMFAEIGEDCYIEPPLYANFGGKHVHLGKGVYANFGLTLVDDGHIYIGDHVMIAPHVTLSTAGHPVLPSLREEQYQYNIAIHIGRNVWIGAGAVILPGITIGENSVIGAGSIVTHDIPANVVAVGNPCRVMREIGERDRQYYYKDREIDL